MAEHCETSLLMAQGIAELMAVFRYAMSGVMVGTGTLGIIQREIHKQVRDEGILFGGQGRPNDGTESQLNAAAQDFIPCGNQHRDATRAPNRRNDRVASTHLNA